MDSVRIAEGITRKVSLLFVGLSFIGWIIFTTGFGLLRDADENIFAIFLANEDSNLFGLWAASVVGPFLHILAVVHALLWGFPGSIVGSITAVLSVLYLTGIGFGMIAGGIVIRIFNDEIPDNVKLIFAGGLLTAVFWAIHLAFWPWFKKDKAEERDYSTA